MRIIVNFSKNTEPVPTNNQEFINSYVHKCLGRNNDYHDSYSDYNISLLLGHSFNSNAFDFPNGGKLVISTKDAEFLNKLLSGIMVNPDLLWGMKYVNIDFIDEEFYDGVNHFFTLSPILLREILEMGKHQDITKNDANFDEMLTKRTLNKLKVISDKQELNLNLKGFKITSSLNNNKRIDKIAVKSKVNEASSGIFSVTCNKKVAELLYNLGIGQSTGSGFGCICKVENISKYKQTKTIA